MKLSACVTGQVSSAPSSPPRFPAPLLSARGALVRGPRRRGAQHLLSSRSCVLAKNSTGLGFSSAAPVAFLQVRGGGMARGGRVAALAKPAPGPRPPRPEAPTDPRPCCLLGSHRRPGGPTGLRSDQADAGPSPAEGCLCVSHLSPGTYRSPLNE